MANNLFIFSLLLREKFELRALNKKKKVAIINLDVIFHWETLMKKIREQKIFIIFDYYIN